MTFNDFKVQVSAQFPAVTFNFREGVLWQAWTGGLLIQYQYQLRGQSWRWSLKAAGIDESEGADLEEAIKWTVETYHQIGTDLAAMGLDVKPVGHSERASVIALLRRVCEVHGDNDWPDDLHLGDVIEKHLARHLGVEL